jgi:hypothetical protein
LAVVEADKGCQGAVAEGAVYRSSGYREIPAFNAEPFAHHWFEKRLG